MGSEAGAASGEPHAAAGQHGAAPGACESPARPTEKRGGAAHEETKVEPTTVAALVKKLRRSILVVITFELNPSRLCPKPRGVNGRPASLVLGW